MPHTKYHQNGTKLKALERNSPSTKGEALALSPSRSRADQIGLDHTEMLRCLLPAGIGGKNASLVPHTIQLWSANNQPPLQEDRVLGSLASSPLKPSTGHTLLPVQTQKQSVASSVSLLSHLQPYSSLHAASSNILLSKVSILLCSSHFLSINRVIVGNAITCLPSLQPFPVEGNVTSPSNELRRNCKPTM